eukprot:Sspe_Gene.9670::Locus_3253_Transcript_1_1_Confidence_1.000_Length_1509::g.9670::m.9670/K17844/PTBP3, ROD1; polypyrimidine tract-binding protein 3
MANAPSPVIMIRSVPQGVTERDLETWASSFPYFENGQQTTTRCIRSLLLNDRSIGFVQMSSLRQAESIMDTFNRWPQQVYITHHGQDHPLNLIYSDKQEIKAQPRARDPVPTGETRILLVVLKNLTHTIMMDDLFWIFTQFGEVQKLSAFTKNMKNQVLVQYESRECASMAMAYLNGKGLTFTPPSGDPTGTCEFAIVPSRLKELTFKNQDQKNRDYERQNTVIRTTFEQGQMSGRLQEAFERLAESMKWSIRDFCWGSLVKGIGKLDPAQDDPSQYGTIPIAENDFMGIPLGQVGDCVLVSHMPVRSTLESKHDPRYPPFDLKAHMLWRLCGMYGEIVAVKGMFKYPGSYLIQFANRENARSCMKYLHDVELWGEKIGAVESKNANAMHWSGANTELEENMCTAFIINERRTRPQPPRTPQTFNYHKPTRNLYLWDVPDAITEEDIRQVFSRDACPSPGLYGRVRS